MKVPADSSKRNTTSYVVLGLLTIREWSTYELAQQARRTIHWFWPRVERRLYDEPKTLAASGLANARHESTGQRRRTIYSITPAGREALSRWLVEPSAPPTTEFEAMAKVFFADIGTLEQLTAVIDEMATSAEERLAELLAMAEESNTSKTQFPERRHINALAVNLQLHREAAVLRWARWAKSQTANWNSTTDPGAWKPAEALEYLLRDMRALLAGARSSSPP